jgi:diguanylate cyclase (GGDEF)-like protein/PAS domain S-box-containing protein
MTSSAARWIEDAPDGIIVVDGEGLVRFANRATGTLFRCASQDLVGTCFGFPMSAGEAAEIEIPQDGGNWGMAEMRVAPSEWEGAPAYVAVLRDVTPTLHMRHALQQEGELLASLVQSLPVALVALSSDRSVRLWNPAAERMFGWRADEVVGMPCPLLGREQWPDFEQVNAEIAAGQVVADFETVRRTKSGDRVEVALHAAPLRDRNGRSEGLLCLMTDIGERHRAEQRLQLSDKVFQNTQEGIVVTDGVGNIVSVNPAFTAVTGYLPEEVMGRNPKVLQSGRHDQAFYDAMWAELKATGQWQGEIWNRRRNGEIYPEWLHISAVRDAAGCVVYYVAVFSDISVVKENEERLHHLAHFDALTGLPNRVLFADRLSQAMAHAKRGNADIGLLFLDLDRFKLINDTLGHRAGDTLLQLAAERIMGAVREQDTVARLGGDEFTVILPEVAGPAGAANVAEKIIESLSASFRIENQEVSIGASIGIAVYPLAGEDVETLVKHADIAMYRAKEAGRNNYQFYRPGHEGQPRDIFELEHGLRRALERHEMRLVYQPQIEIESGTIVALEALLRWDHPTRGDIPPADFIPVAEDSGLIGSIGEWVLREACLQNKAWQDHGLPPVRVAVNMSVRQLRNARFAKRVSEILEETGLDPRWLEIEITESMVMQFAKDVMDVLWHLKSLGIRLSIDDFGTGYSSLSYLKRLPVDTLKIDRSFIEGLDSNLNDQAISNAIIAVANSLSLRVVAEGVETEKQLWFLRQHSCCDAQGFFFCRPIEAGDVGDMMRNRLH